MAPLTNGVAVNMSCFYIGGVRGGVEDVWELIPASPHDCLCLFTFILQFLLHAETTLQDFK